MNNNNTSITGRLRRFAQTLELDCQTRTIGPGHAVLAITQQSELDETTEQLQQRMSDMEWDFVVFYSPEGTNFDLDGIGQLVLREGATGLELEGATGLELVIKSVDYIQAEKHTDQSQQVIVED